MGTVYALLVGINDYRAVRPLKGAVNDIRRVSELLDSMTAQVDSRSLVDGAATRAAVAAGITGHLGRARASDTALFWFSGHGSQRPVPSRWSHREPSGLMQTLVCFDSRTNGVPDLDDKDLAELLRMVAAGGAHVVAVLDCCHAEGGTRDNDDLRVRGVEPWSPGNVPSLVSTRQAAPLGAAPTHVLLAACRTEQRAYEIPTPDGDHGAFTFALLNQIGRLGPVDTYLDLLVATSCQVETTARGQRPVLEPLTGVLVDQPFLGGLARRTHPAATLRHTGGDWQIDVGACHGIVPSDGVEPIEFAVVGATPQRLVRVLEVRSTHSRVELVDWEPGERRHFAVVPVRLPGARMTVEVDKKLTAEQIVCLRKNSPIFAVETGHAMPDVRVVPDQPGRVRVTGGDGAGEVVAATELDVALTHVARWRMTKTLANPASRLSGAVRMDVYSIRDGVRDQLPQHVNADGVLELSYRVHGTEPRPPQIHVRLHNIHDDDLYCVLLDLTDRFACHAELFPGSWVGAHRTAWAAYGDPIEIAVPEPHEPDALTRDWFKLVVAERPFSPASYLLTRLGDNTRSATNRFPSDYPPVPGITREAAPKRISPPCDWTTSILPILTRTGQVGPPSGGGGRTRGDLAHG